MKHRSYFILALCFHVFVGGLLHVCLSKSKAKYFDEIWTFVDVVCSKGH